MPRGNEDSPNMPGMALLFARLTVKSGHAHQLLALEGAQNEAFVAGVKALCKRFNGLLLVFGSRLAECRRLQFERQKAKPPESFRVGPGQLANLHGSICVRHRSSTLDCQELRRASAKAPAHVLSPCTSRRSHQTPGR